MNDLLSESTWEMNAPLGLVPATFHKLRNLFGEPSYSELGYACYWRIALENGEWGAIYSQKMRAHLQLPRLWHVTGNTPAALHTIANALNVRPFRLVETLQGGGARYTRAIDAVA